MLILCAGAYADSALSESPGVGNSAPEAQSNLSVPVRAVLAAIPYYSFFLAGLDAFALCFHGPQKIVRRLLLFVALPSVPGLLALAADRFLEREDSASVLLLPSGRIQQYLSVSWELLAATSIGMCMWLAGIVLLAVGVWRVTKGHCTLPVGFGPRLDKEWPPIAPGAVNGSLLRYFLAILFLTQLTHFVAVWLANRLLPDASTEWLMRWLPLINAACALLPSLVPVLCAVWLLRVLPRSILPGCLRRFGAFDAAVALALPAALTLLPPLLIGAFRHVRAQINPLSVLPAWLQLDPSALNPWDLAMLLPAFAEELGWRCALQPVLTRRFGVRRGLLLVGLVWGLWHLPGNGGFVGQSVFAPLAIFVRLLSLTLLGACLGWLFLRTNSVWPVTLLHGAHNILQSRLYFVFPLELLDEPRGLLTWLLLAACAYALYRFWPSARVREVAILPGAVVPSRWAHIPWLAQQDSAD